MAITLLSQSPPTQYPWGYMVRFDLQNTETGAVINREGDWKMMPSPAEIDAACMALIAFETARLTPPDPDTTMTVVCDDGTEVTL